MGPKRFLPPAINPSQPMGTRPELISDVDTRHRARSPRQRTVPGRHRSRVVANRRQLASSVTPLTRRSAAPARRARNPLPAPRRDDEARARQRLEHRGGATDRSPSRAPGELAAQRQDRDGLTTAMWSKRTPSSRARRCRARVVGETEAAAARSLSVVTRRMETLRLQRGIGREAERGPPKR